LDTDIGKLHDAPQVDFIAHRPLADPIGGPEQGFDLFFIHGRQQEGEIVRREILPPLTGLKDL
jgi:hypothetical protein